MVKKIKLSQLVEQHSMALPIIEKAMLDVAWDEKDESTLEQITRQINLWGSVSGMAVEKDVPLGLGDAYALIRFILSLCKLFEKSIDLKREHFERLLVQINRRVCKEVYEDIFSQ